MEKKIEEMAQDIAKVIDDVHAGCRLTDCEDCRYFDNTLEMCKPYAIAERLYALDYRKAPTEDVVPRAEVERLEQLLDAKCDRCIEREKQEVARIVLDDFIIELHKKIPKRFLDNKAVCHIVLNIIDAVHKKLSWKYIGDNNENKSE